MSKKEQKIQERAEWLYYEHTHWSMWKALSVAVREENQKQKERKTGQFSVRQIGLLEYWD
jgi:hypothetical protein